MATLRALWWWIDRWRKSTAYTDMTLMEQGAYRNLLDEAHLRGGPLPTDERILAKACGDQLAWPEVRQKVFAHFEKTPQGYRHPTLDWVMAESARRAAKQHRYRLRHTGGNATGNAHGNDLGNGSGNDPGNRRGSPSPSLSIEREIAQTARGRTPETEPFQPEEALRRLQEAYPQQRVTYGYKTETAWIEQLGPSADSAAAAAATMLAHLENHKRSYEWRVKKMVPALDKWLREGLWQRTMDEGPPASGRGGAYAGAAYEGPDPAGHVPPCPSRAACQARQAKERRP